MNGPRRAQYLFLYAGTLYEYHDVLHAELQLIDGRLPEDRLWFNATIESLGEPGFRELAANYPQ